MKLLFFSGNGSRRAATTGLLRWGVVCDWFLGFNWLGGEERNAAAASAAAARRGLMEDREVGLMEDRQSMGVRKSDAGG